MEVWIDNDKLRFLRIALLDIHPHLDPEDREMCDGLLSRLPAAIKITRLCAEDLHLAERIVRLVDPRDQPDGPGLPGAVEWCILHMNSMEYWIMRFEIQYAIRKLRGALTPDELEYRRRKADGTLTPDEVSV